MFPKIIDWIRNRFWCRAKTENRSVSLFGTNKLEIIPLNSVIWVWFPGYHQQFWKQGFQIKPAAGGISVYSGHLCRLHSFGFQLKKKYIYFFFFFFGENDPPDSFSTLKIPYLTHWITTLLQVPVWLPDVRKSCFRAPRPPRRWRRAYHRGVPATLT
jgi:hypothetical protein